MLSKKIFVLSLTLILLVGLTFTVAGENNDEVEWKRVNHDDLAINFEGEWMSATSENAYEEEERIDFREKSYAEFTFVGSGIRWIGSVGAQRGITDVYIDGEKVDTIDVYNEETEYQQVLFEETDLEEGTHTIRIDPNSNAREGVTLTSVPVDAFEYIPQEGLILNWTFADGNFPDGTSATNPFGFSFIEGKIGDAVQFKGNAGLDVSEDVNVHPEGNSITVTFWLNRNNEHSGEEEVIYWAKADGEWDGDGWFMNIHEEAPISIIADDMVSFGVEDYNANEFFPVDEWVHVAAVYDEETNEATVYRNGEKVDTVIDDEPFEISEVEGESWMGYNGPELGGAYLDASVDDFRIYQKALNEDMVNEIIEYTQIFVEELN